MLRRRAASDVAHDLATPATVLESQLQAMVDGVVPADRENLEAARSAASALGSVVAELNDLASAEAAPLQAQPVAVDLSDAVHDVEMGLDGLAPRAGGRPRGRRSRRALRVTVDPGHLSRVLRNVIGNAIAPQPGGGRVAVVGRGRGQGAGRGPAIRRSASPTRARASRRTTSRTSSSASTGPTSARAVDPATGRPTGSGLGLTIARELLAANGGRIEVERTGPDRHDLPDRAAGRG